MNDIKDLMDKIDVNVRRLIEIFDFIFKYKIIVKGKGLDFAGLKEYVPGEDDASRIDWKSSLRTQRLYVKIFEEERDLDIFVLLDTSASMLFGTQKMFKSEYASIIAGTIGFSALETGDNFGFAFFNDKIKNLIEPSQDISNYYLLLKFLVLPNTFGGKCNLGEALKFLIENLQEKTVLFIISDFIGLDKEWKDAVKVASAKFERVIGIMVRDPRDTFLDKHIGYVRFKDPFSNKVVTVNVDKIKEKFEELALAQEKDVENTFLDVNAGFIKVYTNQEFIEPLIKYLELSE